MALPEIFINSPDPGIVAPIAVLSGNGGDITANQTSFSIAAALPTQAQGSGFQFHAIIGAPDSTGEVIVIPTQTGTALTGITRGASPQSTKTAWPDGTPIYPIVTAEALVNAFTGTLQINTPFRFSMPADSTGDGDWVPVTPKYYDVTAAPFTVNIANSDNTFPLNFAVYTLSKLGITGLLPPGTYDVATAGQYTIQSVLGVSQPVPVPPGTGGATAYPGILVMGNAMTGGNSTDATSTWAGMLEGMTPQQSDSGKTSNNTALAETQIVWTGGTGYTGAMVFVNGPTSVPVLRNIHFNGGSGGGSYVGPAMAMIINSSRRGIFEDLTFDNTVCGQILATVICENANLVNCAYNTFRRCQFMYTGNSGTATHNWGLFVTCGVLLGDPGPTGNSCYNRWYECQWGATQATNYYDIIWQGADSNTIYSCNAHRVAFDYGANAPIPTGVLPNSRVAGNPNGGSWPAGNKIYDIEQGGNSQPASNLGSPAAASMSPNEIHQTNIVNGPSPNPNLANLKWNSENLNGTGPLVNGVFTLPTWVTNFIKNSVIGGSPPSTCYFKAHYIGLVSGPVGVLVPVVATNGSTAVINSYVPTSSGTPAINTNDQNELEWELVYS